MPRLTCLLLLLLGMTACEREAPDYQTTGETLCTAFLDDPSPSGRSRLARQFLIDHPDFAGGAFDAEALVDLLDRALAERPDEPEGDPTELRITDCTEFILAHWLIGEIDN